MPAFTLDDLTTPLTREEVKAKIYEVVALVGTDTTSWKPGAVARSMIVGFSVVGSAFSVLTSKVARGGFLDTATGKWLELKAWYDFRVEKSHGTYAEGEVTLTNDGGAAYEWDVDDLVVANSETGKEFVNTSPVSMPPLGTVVVPVRAREAGSKSTSAPGEISFVVTSVLGISCTNAAPVVGLDADSDPTVRAKCLEKLGSLSPMGPWDAYTYAARTALRSDGSTVGVTRVRSTKDGFGNVTTYVATASGIVSGDDDDPQTDLGAINEAIQQFAAPLAVNAVVASAIPVSCSVSYVLTMYNTSGLSQPQIVDAIEKKLTSFFASQPIGGNRDSVAPGKVYVDAIEAAIASALPQIFHVDVSVPAADIELDAYEVPVLGLVTPTLIKQVAPGEGAVL